jgi:ppGpp synthetase/RelA/SpoT-type nucleotidyltranferase
MDQTDQLSAQVAAFQEARPRYIEGLCEKLEAELKHLAVRVCSGATVTARAKTVASFAEKILRKGGKYRDPLHDMTDLCGARIIVDLLTEVAAVGELIRQNFAVDEENSVDALSRLQAAEFGYRSVHYIVSFQRDRHPGLPEEYYATKAEVQVRTSVQHAWSAIGHDRIYKSPHALPEILKRDAARIAAQLEGADDEFGRMVKEVEEYRSNLDVYLQGDKLTKEIVLLETLGCYDPDNATVALRRAQLALAKDDWPAAVSLIEKFPDSKTTPALQAALGYALCQKYGKEPQSPDYVRGQKFLRMAAEARPADAAIWVRLADTYQHTEPTEAMEYYRQAYAADPTDPAALLGYIRLHMAVTHETKFVALLRPAIEAAIGRCERRAAMEIDLPATLYRAAVLQLLLGPDQRHEALRALTRAICRTPTETPMRLALGAVQRMARFYPQRSDIECAQRLLQLAIQVHSPNDAESKNAVKELATPAVSPITGPVVIVVGFCNPLEQKSLPEARAILRTALDGFRGTIISGGTQQGVAGLVGELGAASGGAIRTIGYLPKIMPADNTATRDNRYDELRLSRDSDGFSPLEPLQSWADLLTSGIVPANVTVLGIGGGQIAACEYRLALALGARVGIILDSGRQADVLADDPEWAGNPRLQRFRRELLDKGTFFAFAHPPSNSACLDRQEIDRLGQIVHNNYLKVNPVSPGSEADVVPSRRKWENLPPDLQASSKAQIIYAAEILSSEGYAIVKHTGANKDIPLVEFSPTEIDRMGELEHGRWNIERLAAGWTLGPKNVEKKVTPWLMSWKDLPDYMKEYDRDAIRNYAAVLREAGFAIVKAGSATAAPKG